MEIQSSIFWVFWRGKKYRDEFDVDGTRAKIEEYEKKFEAKGKPVLVTPPPKQAADTRFVKSTDDPHETHAPGNILLERETKKKHTV